MEFLNLTKLCLTQYEFVGYYERKLNFLTGSQNAPYGMLLVFQEGSKTVLEFLFFLSGKFIMFKVGKPEPRQRMRNLKWCKCKRPIEILNGKTSSWG